MTTIPFVAERRTLRADERKDEVFKAPTPPEGRAFERVDERGGRISFSPRRSERTGLRTTCTSGRHAPTANDRGQENLHVVDRGR